MVLVMKTCQDCQVLSPTFPNLQLNPSVLKWLLFSPRIWHSECFHLFMYRVTLWLPPACRPPSPFKLFTVITLPLTLENKVIAAGVFEQTSCNYIWTVLYLCSGNVFRECFLLSASASGWKLWKMSNVVDIKAPKQSCRPSHIIRHYNHLRLVAKHMLHVPS